MTPPNTEEIDRLRWEGEVSSNMKETSRRLEGISQRQQRTEVAVETLSLEVAVMRTRVAFFSALGAIVGGGLVSFAMDKLG